MTFESLMTRLENINYHNTQDVIDTTKTLNTFAKESIHSTNKKDKIDILNNIIKLTDLMADIAINTEHLPAFNKLAAATRFENEQKELRLLHQKLKEL